MKKSIMILSTAGMLLLMACAPSAEEISAKEKQKADSVAAQAAGVSEQSYKTTETDQSEPAPPQTGQAKEADKKIQNPPQRQSLYDSVYRHFNENRRLIKTANLVFKVANVEKATLQIENIAYIYGGFTLKSEIRTTEQQSSSYRINKDSIYVVGVNEIENNMCIRVPQAFLDTVLMRFSRIWLQLDERSVNAEDVTVSYLANELRSRVKLKTALTINKAAQQGGKTTDLVDAAQSADNYMSQGVDRQIENLELQDKVDFATINIRIYQDQTQFQRREANYKIEEYRESFGSRMADSLLFGWDIVLGLLLFLAKGWSVFLIMLGGFLLVFYFVKWMVRRSKGRS
jgi:hypothetical protein